MSFDEFLSRRLGELLRFAVVLCGDQAEADRIVAAVLVRAFPHWGAISGAGREFVLLRTAVTRDYLCAERLVPAGASCAPVGGATVQDRFGRAAAVLSVYSSQTGSEISAALRRPQTAIAGDLAQARSARWDELFDDLADAATSDVESVVDTVLDELLQTPIQEVDPAEFERLFGLTVSVEPAAVRERVWAPDLSAQQRSGAAAGGGTVLHTRPVLPEAVPRSPAKPGRRTRRRGLSAPVRRGIGALLVIAAATLVLVVSDRQASSGTTALRPADHSPVASVSSSPTSPAAPGLPSATANLSGATVLSQHVGAGSQTVSGGRPGTKRNGQLAISAVCSGPGGASIGSVSVPKCDGTSVVVPVTPAQLESLVVRADPTTTWRFVIVEEPTSDTNGAPRYPADPALRTAPPTARLAQSAGTGSASVDLVSGTTTSRVEHVRLLLTCTGAGVSFSSTDHSFDGRYTRTCRAGWSYEFDVASALVPDTLTVTAAPDTSWEMAVIRV